MVVRVAPPNVVAVIAAYNAEATIARAIRSALAEPEVAQVIVVDDCSTDATRTVALACDDGSGRLTVERLPANAGPSAARNHAIAMSHTPFVAVLDSDDFFLPGRFASLFESLPWDMVADDIAFVDETRIDSVDLEVIADHRTSPRRLDAASFVMGCITRRDRHKQELGFLKVVWRRAFLDAHALRFDETLRLAEDYEIYTRALLHGARFVVDGRCHYVAVERRGSLSDRHDERDLANLAVACRSLIVAAAGQKAVLKHLRQHERQIRRKKEHRAFLADKRSDGMARTLTARVTSPMTLALIAADVIRDKLAPLVRGTDLVDGASVRYLLGDSVTP